MLNGPSAIKLKKKKKTEKQNRPHEEENSRESVAMSSTY